MGRQVTGAHNPVVLYVSGGNTQVYLYTIVFTHNSECHEWQSIYLMMSDVHKLHTNLYSCFM